MSQAIGIVVGADDLVMVINVESESEDRLWWIDRSERGANLCPQSGRPDTRQKKHSSHFGKHGNSIFRDLVTSHTILCTGLARASMAAFHNILPFDLPILWALLRA